MNLQYNGQEVVPASKAAVWAFINDPAKIASCLPDVLDTQVHDPHDFDATVKVAVGPVRGKFKFKIALDPGSPVADHMNMKISGGGLGSVVDLLAGADVKDNGDGTTTLDWTRPRHRCAARSRRSAAGCSMRRPDAHQPDLRQRQDQG